MVADAAAMNEDDFAGMTTIRSSRTTIVIFGAMASVMGLPGVYWLWSGYGKGAIVLLLGVFVFLPALRYRISWSATTLSYRGVLFNRCVDLSDVRGFDMGSGATGGPFGPTIGLRIFTGSVDRPSMIINLKPFARDDIAKLLCVLNRRQTVNGRCKDECLRRCYER